MFLVCVGLHGDGCYEPELGSKAPPMRKYQPTGTPLDPERVLKGKHGPLIKTALALAVDLHGSWKKTEVHYGK